MGKICFLYHPMCAMMVTQVEIQEDGGNPTCSSDVDPTWTKVGTNWIMSEVINPVIIIIIIINEKRNQYRIHTCSATSLGSEKMQELK